MFSCLLRPYAEETSARAVRLFTLAVVAGNQGFLAIGDWLKSYAQQLKELFDKVHYVRDVTQGEDKSRIRITPLPQILAIARNLAINLYRDAGFSNMTQAKRKCLFGLEHILSLFRMK